MKKTWDEKTALVHECQQAKEKGISVKQWCEENGISYKTYFNWLRELSEKTKQTMNQTANRSTGPDKYNQQAWAQLPISGLPANKENEYSESGGRGIQITCNGFTIGISNVVNADTLSIVLKAVKQTCC